MKILILKRDKLGDLLLTTPMLRVLREAMPKAEIHLLASNYNDWVVDGLDSIDRRWVYGRVRTGRKINIPAALAQIKLYLQLRLMRFDVAIAAGGEESHRALNRALQVGAKRTIGYAESAKWKNKISDALTSPKHVHETMRIAQLLAPLGIAIPERLPFPQFIPPAFALNFADDWLRQNGLKANSYAVFGLGARRAQKQPSAAQILRWSIWLKVNHDLDTVFMWTPGKSDNPLYPGDDEIAQPVLDAKSPNIFPFRGPLKEAIGIVFRARFSIFPDSGLMHFAAASPGGVLGLFGDTANTPSPKQWGPVGARVDYLEAPRAIADVDDATVFARIEKLLG